MCWAGWTGRVAEASWSGMTFGTRPGAPVPGGFLPEEGFVRSRRGGLARGRLDFGQVRPSMSERACQKPFRTYLKVKSYVDI